LIVVMIIGLMVVLDMATSIPLLGLTGGAAGIPLRGLMPGARVTPPLTPEAVPVKGRTVVLSAGA
jgi:hypothetical protein